MRGGTDHGVIQPPARLGLDPAGPSPPWPVPPCFGAGPPAATSRPHCTVFVERGYLFFPTCTAHSANNTNHQASSSRRFPLLLGSPLPPAPYSVGYFTSTSRGNNEPVFLIDQAWFLSTALLTLPPPTSTLRRPPKLACPTRGRQSASCPPLPRSTTPQRQVFSYLQSLAPPGAPGAGSLPSLSRHSQQRHLAALTNLFTFSPKTRCLPYGKPLLPNFPIASTMSSISSRRAAVLS
jgi:hypothetical protein